MFDVCFRRRRRGGEGRGGGGGISAKSKTNQHAASPSNQESKTQGKLSLTDKKVIIFPFLHADTRIAVDTLQ